MTSETETRLQARNLIEKHEGITRATATDVVARWTDDECARLAAGGGDPTACVALIASVKLRVAQEDLAAAKARAEATTEPLTAPPAVAEAATDEAGDRRSRRRVASR